MTDIKYFISGGIAGCIQSIIGHPLDTLKTISQNKMLVPSYTIKILYRGLTPSLIQSSLLTGSSFYSNNYFYNVTHNNLLSSLYTGFLGCLIICPLEQIKIQKQSQHDNSPLTLHYLRTSYRYMYLVSLREIPAITLYFSSYRYLRENQINIILGGGLSGCLSWLITYPIDTIKSRLQSGVCTSLKESLLMGKLYKGLSYCLVRAFLVNSASFYTYENLITFLS